MQATRILADRSTELRDYSDFTEDGEAKQYGFSHGIRSVIREFVTAGSYYFPTLLAIGFGKSGEILKLYML